MKTLTAKFLRDDLADSTSRGATGAEVVGGRRMTRYGRRTPLAVFALVAFLLALMYAFMGTFVRPAFDDYVRIGLPLDIGVWEAMLYFRETWNGDYTNFLFQGLLAPLGWQVTQVMPLLLLLTMLPGYRWLVNAIMPWKKSCADRRLTAVSLATIVTVAAIKAFRFEVFYGYTALVEYTLPAAVLLLGIAGSVEVAKRLRGKIQHGTVGFAIAFLAFLNAGFSEMHLVFQLAFVTLVVFSIIALYRGPRRETWLMLALAACLGTLASLPAQLSSPGVHYRSSLPDNFGYIVAPVRDLPTMIYRATDLHLTFLGDENVFAGFMLAASAALFATLTVGDCLPLNRDSRRFAAARSPIALALILQLLLLPVLWSHQSDNGEFLGRFSAGFMLVVCVNLCVILGLLALLWRRQTLDVWLSKSDGLMIYCSVVLLAVCALFLLTQIRSIHYKAAFYLFATVIASLFMLAGQLSSRVNGLFQLTLFLFASAMITQAALIATALFGVGYTFERTLSGSIFLLIGAGLCCGVMLGALIQRGCSLTGSREAWMRWLRLPSLLLVIAIALGEVPIQARLLEGMRFRAAVWDANAAEIIRLRDEGDAAVYTKSFKIAYDISRGENFRTRPLSWVELAYYDLDYTLPEILHSPNESRDE